MNSRWLFVVTSVPGSRIKNKPWVWYSHNIQPMMKMFNHNITKHGTQATGLGVLIGRCSPDSQHGRPDRHSANVDCSFFRYKNNDISNQNDQRPKRKTWTKEDNHLALYCHFRSNSSQRGHRKRMIVIWQECASFQTKSQRLADQVRTIIKKRMVFWPWNTRNTPENTDARQYNSKRIKWHQRKTTYQKWTANYWKWIRHSTK